MGIFIIFFVSCIIFGGVHMYLETVFIYQTREVCSHGVGSVIAAFNVASGISC